MQRPGRRSSASCAPTRCRRPATPRPDKAAYGHAAAALEAALDAAAAVRPQPGPRGRAPPESHRVRERHSRSAGARGGREGAAAGRRARSAELRQRGQRAVGVAARCSRTISRRRPWSAGWRSATRQRAPSEDIIRVPTAMVQDDRASDDLPFGSRGGTSIRHSSRLTANTDQGDCCAGSCICTSSAWASRTRSISGWMARWCSGSPWAARARGAPRPKSFAGNTQGDPEWEVYMHTADEGLAVRVPVKAGTHGVGVSFVRRVWEPEGHPAAAAARLRPHDQRAVSRRPGRGKRGDRRALSAACRRHRSAARRSPAGARVFVCGPPATQASEDACARRILSRAGHGARTGGPCPLRISSR